MEPRMAVSPEHQHRNSLPRISHLNHPPSTHPASHPPPPSPLPPPPTSATPSNHGGPSPVYSYAPPQSAYGPPPSYYPHHNGRPDHTPEKTFPGEASGHVTPVNTSASEYQLGGAPPPSSGTPSQAPPVGPIHQHMDRSHENSQAPPGPQASQPSHPPAPPPPGIGYPPAAGPGNQPPYFPPHHQQLAHVGPAHMPHIMEQGGYVMHHPPAGFPIAYPPMAGLPYETANHLIPMKDKRKGHRAAQACEACRTRKSKCDEERPLCTSCKENGHECTYRDSVPNKIVDKSLSAATITSITNMNEIVSTLPNISQDLVDRLERIEHLHTSQDLVDRLDRIEQLLSNNELETKREDVTRRDTPAAESFSKPKNSQSADSPANYRSMSIHSQSASVQENKDGQQKASAKGDIPDSTQVFDEHTTAAHKLLYLWPSIQNILRNNCRADYVMSGEARGWLQLDGQGESAKAVPLDDRIDGMTGIEWNMWDQHTNMLDEHRRQEPVLDNVALDLREETVMALVEKYRIHIHALHPFLHLPTLRSFAAAFVDYHAQSTLPSGGVPSPASMANGEFRSNKRKRSDAFPSAPRLNDERSLPVAIMYLVLALGRVVDYQSVVPGPAAVTESMPPPRIPHSASPASNYKPSPSSSGSFGAPTPPSFNNRTSAGSPQSLYDAPTPGITYRRGRSTNVEDIPGLAYFREGCLILGLHADSNDIMVAQARLLAGLYKGQLGRVQESWSWIHDACRVCRYQTRARGLDRGKASEYQYKHPSESRQGAILNTVLVTCWSALQLESDILAEMDYPHSGIASVQEVMPYPQVSGSMDYHPAPGSRSVMYYYVLQLYLRKRLNYMHNNIYGKSVIEVDIHTLEENEISLDKFRELYDWDDNEPPATNILDARLRGKFYGARYICLRPYLDYVLHAMRERRAGIELANCAKDAFGKVRINDLKIFQAIATLPDAEIKRKAQKCIRSAMLSTEAFDGAFAPGNRLIVTNIMGTSHAQFSNMLTLAAAYHSGLSFLTGLITKEKMKYLLKRTIGFLGQIKYCCATANEDIRILKMVQSFLFDDADDESASSSFASATSASRMDDAMRQ